MRPKGHGIPICGLGGSQALTTTMAQLGRFIQPDTIVPEPGNPQALNRYSYVGNRPTVYIDPDGHCSTPSVNGSIGCTSVTGGLTMPLVIDPATQPLTVSASNGPQDTQRARMSAARTAADDGVFLMYQIPGYANGRAEVVIVNAGVPDNSLVNGGVEVRRVWAGNESYEETAVNGGIGLFGAEWSSRKGETVPSIGTNIAGVGVQLQPGQLMAGVVNPMGPGGMRVGAEWRVEFDEDVHYNTGVPPRMGWNRRIWATICRIRCAVAAPCLRGTQRKHEWYSIPKTGQLRLRFSLRGAAMRSVMRINRVNPGIIAHAVIFVWAVALNVSCQAPDGSEYAMRRFATGMVDATDLPFGWGDRRSTAAESLAPSGATSRITPRARAGHMSMWVSKS